MCPVTVTNLDGDDSMVAVDVCAQAMCKFSGLVAFPFDKLKCEVEFGGWVWSGGFQGMLPLDGGFSLSTQEATSGSSYQVSRARRLPQRADQHRAAVERQLALSLPWPRALRTRV